jgi:hypothetical protein
MNGMQWKTDARRARMVGLAVSAWWIALALGCVVTGLWLLFAPMPGGAR